MKKLGFIIVLIQGLLLTHAFAQTPTLPDGALTPGNVMTTDLSLICSPGYPKSARHVTNSTKVTIRAQYGIPESQRWQYVIDHLVPLSLGGSNTVTNLWPEPISGVFWTARRKDRLTLRLRKAVCHNAISITDAQTKIATDWQSLFQTYFPDEHP